MTLDQLRIFLAVAEREHVTRAAESLNLTQSSVSAAIAALEERYGTHLFHRVGRRIELTETGRAFMPEAQAVLARADAARRLLADVGGLERGSLAIAASQTIAAYWLPAELARFHAAHPPLALRVTIGNTHEVAQAVLDGSAELGFVEGALDEPALATHPVGADRLVVVAAQGHPAALDPAAAAAALAGLPWIQREPGSGTRAEAVRGLTALGIDPGRLHVVLEMPSNEAVLGAVEAGLGVAAISELVAAARLELGRLVRLPVELQQRRFLALWHKERYRSQASRRFITELGAG